MKTIEETRRGMFEAWYENRSGCRPRLQESGRYSDVGPDLAWEGFNAALDAVVIELPKISDQAVEDHYSWASCEEKTRTAIESTNLGLKIR